jgi:D-inositol-3-phosphate glycosyltransferase
MAEMKRRGRPEELEISQRDASESEIARAAASVVVWTDDEKEAVVNYCGVDSDNVSVIPPGVDLSRFHPMSQRQSRDYLGYGPEKNILFVGRLEPLKGIDNLFRAVASLENLKFITLSVVGGDGNSQEKTRLEALVKKMRLNQTVHFLGPIPQEELPIHYNAADVCVLPSYYESFGLAALEAAACGKPVVASEVGGLPAIVNDGVTGYLVPPKRMDVIAERLCELLEDDLLRVHMGTAARIHAESLGWDSSADSLLRCFRELVTDTVEPAISVAGG